MITYTQHIKKYAGNQKMDLHSMDVEGYDLSFHNASTFDKLRLLLIYVDFFDSQIKDENVKINKLLTAKNNTPVSHIAINKLFVSNGL